MQAKPGGAFCAFDAIMHKSYNIFFHLKQETQKIQLKTVRLVIALKNK